MGVWCVQEEKGAIQGVQEEKGAIQSVQEEKGALQVCLAALE
jgi:hypothetical protein